ncbi:glycerol uptake facilitator protein [Sphingobacterium allocomposti]|jgi:glycerol uptake facilitator protein|uniref:Glycerol uptake facilitator protein n=1 Tax=Sphingobacterium allocomposti TaxID=415956 RepID=A0A5S5DPE2_9SPHI|nr:MIP/aquaporin family protein [Sphingobacterium composti Yoo et al. 2007 non Ten et al. 2007]TYP96896.1 glycerol uptake facilitator protein [Sphingobacterium composti Yoo et al. 2007 non Ten et al. 2007]HLS94812.1 MIP/aquaporin family protein [Sphingobacterium sp.]
MTPFLAELIGTAAMILLGGGVVANVVLKGTKGHDSGWIVICTAWALAVFVGVTIAGPHSGAHLNCAVTLANLVLGKLDLLTSLSYMAAQFMGAMLGAFIVWLMYKDHFDHTEDAGAKQAVFCTAPAIRNLPINLVSEVVGTFVLIFTILHFTDASMGDDTPIGLGSIGAIPVTFLVWVIGLSLGGTTGYAINPARDLGPRIVHALLPLRNKAHFNGSYAWVPVIGPLLGALLAAFLYLCIY